ncbi:MAG TPA: efflux RND transporter permease subunit, partial [Novosphingobium sp.]
GRGQVSISATFAKGTNPDIAQVQVQNRVQQALSRLPQQVQQQGVTVTKSNPDALMVVGIYDRNDRYTNMQVADWMVSNLQDRIGRIEGVGDTNVFGSQFAMRVWLDPHRLAAFALMPGDVVNAITAQNADVAAGEVGGVPSPAEQRLDATVTGQSRLQTPDQFAQIVVKTQPDGSTVLLRDVARIELGAESYGVFSTINGHPGAGLMINLAPGADALSTADRVKAAMEDARSSFPPGFAFEYAQDSTIFIKQSIGDVEKTLFEAIVLVIAVIFVFLQSWRATLVPAIAVPVVLLGTFAIFSVAGFSINTLTLFGMVLAIGLLVDDAIVVVENVERLMAETPGMTPREATIESMRQIQVALVAIALVLSAVFLPMAFFGGSAGVIYRQFSLTIVGAMALSVFVALILSPALTSTLLKRPEEEDHTSLVGRASFAMRDWFEARFERLVGWYHVRAERVIDRRGRYLMVYAGLAVLLAALFTHLPTGFLPVEDQGLAQVQFNLPAGATIERTRAVQQTINDYFLKQEKGNLSALLTVSGTSGGAGGGQNTGRGFVALKDWDARAGQGDTSADAIARRANMAMSGLRDVEFFATVPAAVRGLGQSSGFTAELLNSSGMARDAFANVQADVLAEARADKRLANVRLSSLPDQPSLKVDVDAQRLAVLGLSQADVNATLSTAWGGRYVNDFVDRGRVKRVYVQGDAPYRHAPEDLGSWQVRGSSGQMVPFSAFAGTSWSQAPTSLSRFNGTSNYEFSGQAAPGYSSGEAMDAFAAIVAKHEGVSVGWAGTSYQERLTSGQAPVLYALSLLVVFLCLAALYESWSIPVAVLLVIPLGLIGAVLAVTLRGLQNDV